MKNKITILIAILILITNAVSAQWIALNTSLGKEIKAMVKNGDALVVGTADAGVYISKNADQTWNQKISGLNNQKVYSLASNGTTIAAGTYGGGVFLSNNNGESWTSTSGISVPYIYSISFIGNNILAGTGGAGLFISSDNGGKWANVFPSSLGVYAIYPGTTTSYCGIGPYICKSTDNGNTWNNVVASNTTIKAYAETPIAAGGTNLFVGSLDGMFLSVDGGKNWKTINAGLLYKNINALAVSGQTVFAATENGGVYRTTDNGTSWNEINTGFRNSTTIRGLVINNGILYAAASSGVIYKRNLSEVATEIKKFANNLPTSFSLKQNYPNPFNPETTISYSINSSSFVTLKVFDLLGNEVATLVDEFKNAGNYNASFTLNKSKNSSGVYLYTLKSNGFSLTKKMLLLK